MAAIAWLAMALMGSGSPAALSCTVEGSLKAGLEPQAICRRFAEAMSAAGRAYVLKPAGSMRDGVRVAIRFERGDTVSATATIFRGGRAHPLETRLISSSDRPLGLDSIGLLARDVAQAVAKSD
ncbi:hypothetical protein ABS767_05510 [Sphingomonas sp. ST-64]|uniref:Uncharacterized protein n=1 Tax=Sphingomonas plantiphila TaxID=3163295 RepID=A0ABW8YJN6_9SPHN